MPDAVIIGAGPNGLVAANVLADAGWEVVVLEAQPEPGGAVRTLELTRPGFAHDLGAAFYPLGVASPIIRALALEEHGLRWAHAPVVLANPTVDGPCATLSTDLDETAASLDAFAPGDGDAWRRMFADWERLREPLLEALFTPFPPVRGGVALAASLRRDLLRFVRFALLPVRRMAEERFDGAGAGLLLAGNALHTDLTPESSLSGIFGWLLTCLGQDVGFPVVEGGSGALTAALVRRLEDRGGQVVCGTPVERIEVRRGRAVGVRTVGGDHLPARHAVLADVAAPALYGSLVDPEHLPSRLLDDLRRFEWDMSVFKVDWALSGPVPWEAADARRAAVVHTVDDVDHLSELAYHLATRRIAARPFVLFGQQSLADPSRAPAGCHTGWGYAHLPRGAVGDAGGELSGRWLPGEADVFADRLEARIERLAPGFRDRILDRSTLTPAELEDRDANLAGGAINGGTSQLHQQLVFRPTPGLGRPGTPVRRLFLASSSAHPGGGVHGGPGANAARAAISARRARTAGRAGAALAGAGGLARAASAGSR